MSYEPPNLGQSQPPYNPCQIPPEEQPATRGDIVKLWPVLGNYDGDMTNPSRGAEGQPTQQSGAPPPPPPPPPDVSWIEFDIGLRNQDPAAIEHKAIKRKD